MLDRNQKIAADLIFVKGRKIVEPMSEEDRSQTPLDEPSDWQQSLKTFDGVGVALPEPLDRPRIILADDDASMCDYLQRLLSKSYEVEIVADGVEAMAAIDRQPPDLVLTDVMMPNLDGLELLRSIRARPEIQDIPVILLSATDREAARIAGLEAGADDYIIKPFSSRELIARVDATLKLARLRLSTRDRERELQQETDTARANLDRIVTNLNNGFATFDRDWRYTYVNNRLLEIFNLPRERVLGKQAWAVFPHQVGIEFFDLLNRAMTERVEAQFEYYYAQVDCWVEHRVYPTDDGLAILMADVSDRKRTELLAIEQTKLLELAAVELRESESEYRTLFESIDEGYILIEMLFDATDRPIDFRYLDANPAAVTMLGGNPTGRQAREFFPSVGAHWFETLGRVAQTGIGERAELDASSLGAWYNFYAFRIDNADSRQVAVIFEDVTARKRREANTAFLAAIQDDFARLTTADEIVQTVGEKLGRYLDTSQCLFTEIDEAQERAIVEYNWHSADTLDLVGVYQISEFVNAEFYRAVRARETIVVGNTQADARTNADRYAAFNVQAFVHVPFHRSNNWKYLLTINDVRSRDWREDEVELIYEVANRLFPRIERARAEAAVAANLRDTQLLQELGARLVTEDDIHTLYREILAAAIDLTGADAGTIQILDEQTQDLCTIASEGFESSMTTHFARVDASSDTSCGIAIGSGIRTFVDFDAPHPDPHGSMRLHVEAGYLSAQSTPLISRTGKAIGMVSTHWRTHHRPIDRQLQFLDLLARQAADLLEQRQTTAALRDREEQLRLATATSKLGLWFWNLEADTLTWTERCKAIFGLPADLEVSHEIFMAALHPDDRQRTQDAVDRSMKERTDYDIEYRSCWSDGTIHWIAAKGSCTYDTTGTPTQMMGVTSDITDRKLAEESLRESQTRLRFMLDTSEIGDWDLDLTTQPHTAHRSRRHDRIFGYESLLPEWSYDIFLTHVHPDDRAAVDEQFQQTLANNTDWNFECRIVHPDLSLHWIWARSSVYCDSSGRPIRLLGMVVDFTDRKQAEESLAERARQLADLNSRLARSEIQLQERNQELDSFVHIVSHDLKAPLRAVSNLSQWIEEDFEGAVSANTTEQMNLLRGRIHRMESMIDGLLEYARVGRQDIQLELVSVADLLTEVIESIAPPPKFEMHIKPQMPTLETKRLLLSQVFANLISNAFKHHDRSDGSIQISSRELGDGYEFAISDDGPGIAPEQRDRIFVIFQAANPQQHPDSTGIGLSIVKKIVETAGGQIWIESELGRGTTFYFTWPNRSIGMPIY